MCTYPNTVAVINEKSKGKDEILKMGNSQMKLKFTDDMAILISHIRKTI